MSDIASTASANTALLALQAANAQQNEALSRLATGQAIQSPLDGPSAFFAGQDLTNRAATLAQRSDQIGQAISATRVADIALGAIDDLVSVIQGSAVNALSQRDPEAQGRFAEQYRTLTTQIDQLRNDASYGGVNLLQGSSLTVDLGDTAGGSTFTIDGFDASTQGLGLIPPPLVANGNGPQLALEATSSVQENTRAARQRLQNGVGILAQRAEFNENLGNILALGAQDLTGADLAEEAVRATVGRTAQQIAQASVGIATLQGQSILRLLA